jgi:transposase
MNGCLPAPTRRIKEAMKLLVKSDSVEFIEVDKCRTSRVCSSCKGDVLKNVVDRVTENKLHAVLKCSTCSIVWNRDVNVAKNIHAIFIHQAFNSNNKPLIFNKKEKKTIAADITLPRSL